MNHDSLSVTRESIDRLLSTRFDPRGLRLLLAINGGIFLVRAVRNLSEPTGFYLPRDAPAYAKDVVRVLGITYAAFGIIQLAMWVADRRAVRATAGASLLFAAGVAMQALLQGSASSDAFHRLRLGSAAENIGVAALYAALLSTESGRHRKA